MQSKAVAARSTLFICAHIHQYVCTHKEEKKTMQQHAHAVIVCRCLEQIVVRPEDTEESEPLLSHYASEWRSAVSSTSSTNSDAQNNVNKRSSEWW